MMLGKGSILKAIEEGDIHLEPFSASCLKSHSYVLRLGKDWNALDPDGRLLGCVDPRSLSTFRSAVKHYNAASLSLKPLSLVLNASTEALALPSNLAGLLTPLGQLARLGIVQFSSPYIHPGFGRPNGLPVVFEFFHILPADLRLVAGMPFAHLHFIEADDVAIASTSPAAKALLRGCFGSIYDQIEAYHDAIEEVNHGE